MFELGVSYTREEINAQVGGSLQTYLPHVSDRVVAACLRLDRNPDAPAVILVGAGDGIEHAADLLIAQHAQVATFLKRGTDNWEYVGDFDVERWSQDAADLADHAHRSGRDDITRVIHMAPTRVAAPWSPVNQNERAFRAWTILTTQARQHSTMTYGELGAALGVHHRAIRYILAPIQDHCLAEKLPPLTILIVNQGGIPGPGFIAYDVDKFEEGKELVYSYNWASLQNPFEFASDGATYEEIITALAENPDTAIDIMRLVKTRGVAQRMFRDALLRAYQGRCAFTDISFEATLEACHIIPWSSCRPEQRLDVRNGILLNSVHHKLFDNGLVTVTQDFQIWYADPNMQAGPYSEYDRLLSAQLHGTKMRMPISAALWPGHDYLEQSHKLHGWVDCLPPGKGVGTNLGIESAVRFGKLNDGKAPIPESQRGAS